MKRWRLGLLVALLSVLGPAPAASQTAPTEAAYRDAFLAFFPAYEMARLRYTAIEDGSNPRRAQLNTPNHVRRLLDASARNVTTPNNDTLYTSARLDLRLGPVVVETPAVQPPRYYSLQFMNVHTDNLAILGRRDGGDGPLKVALVGPGWAGAVPAHTHLVRADSHDVWLLVRMLVDGPDDLAAVAALQDGIRIQAPAPAADYPAQRLKPPKDPGPADFIAVIGETLQRNPPQGEMAAAAAAAASVGIGGKAGWAELPEDVRAGWLARWPALQAELKDPARLRERSIAGWDQPPANLGNWGGDRLLRASVALGGIAALDLAETLYLSRWADDAGEPLVGSRRYRLRIPPGGLPARAFWSITMYEVQPDGRYFFTDNPLQRDAIGSRTRGLRTQPDGSIHIDVQAEPPADTGNWLPAPAGPFRLALRAYLPAPALVEGRAPLPAVERLP